MLASPLLPRLRAALLAAAAAATALAAAAPAPASAAGGHTYILCQPAEGRLAPRIAKIAPRRCDTLAPSEPLAAGANLARLRWSDWAAASATGRGIERGYHLPFSRIPVQISATKRRRDCHGNAVYARLAITSRYGTTVRRFRPVC